jgi:hypothetical protein
MNHDRLLEAYADLCRRERLMGGVKWTKVTANYLSKYALVVDLLLSSFRGLGVCFRAIIVDESLADYRTFSFGDRELGFYKWYY